MFTEKIVVGLTGMPGSGKSFVVVDTARLMGFDVVVMGDIIRAEVLKYGLDLSPKNVGKIMLKLRSVEGNNVIAHRCIPNINQSKSEKVIIEGIRSLDEVIFFKKKFRKFTLMAVHSSPETRYKRLCNRGRSDDPKSYDVFCERDLRELNVGIGNAVAISEFMIINEENKDKVKKTVVNVLKKVEEKWEV